MNYPYPVSYVVVLVISTVTCCLGIAQSSHAPYLMHWTVEDGLCGNEILALQKDDKGMLWLGTTNGLCRFDGKEFESFPYESGNKATIQTNEVAELMQAANGQIWIGTDGGGLSVFNYANGQFSTIRQEIDETADGLTEDRVTKLLQNKDGEILVGYRAIGSGKGGVTFIGDDLRTKIHAVRDIMDYAGFPMKVTQALQGSSDKNTYWLGGRSFFKWNRSTDKVQEFPHDSFLPSYTSVQGILEVADTTLLVAFARAGAWLFDKENGRWLKQIVHHEIIRDLFRADDGKIWITDSKGIGWFAPGFREVHYEILREGPASPFPPGVFIHRIKMENENLWIATDQGLFCWSPMFQQFGLNTFTYPDGDRAYYPEFVGKVSPNEWVFMDRNNGLLLSDSLLNVQKRIDMPSAVLPRKAIMVNENQQFVLLGAQQGLYKWELGAEQIIPYQVKSLSLSTDSIQAWSFFSDDYRQLWIGTRTSGLLKVNLQNNQLTQFLHDPRNAASLCHNNFLFDMEEDLHGKLWISTDKGVSIIDPQTNVFSTYSGITEIANYVVHCMESDQAGDFWIGTRDQGLFKYDFENAQLTNFNTTDGLLYNGVNKMTTTDSLLWMTTRRGLCKMNITNGNIVSYTQKKGLLDNNLYRGQLGKLPDGKIMLSYEDVDYFAVFDAHDIEDHHTAPQIILKSLRVLRDGADHNRIVTNTESVDLTYQENYLILEFQAIDFYQARSLQYEYQLEGYDPQWISSGKNTTATYTNLPGGDYVFKVRAHNQDGQVSEEQTLAVHLQTAWYKTNLFYLLVVLGVGGFIYAIYIFRTRQIRKEEYFKRQLAETEMKALRAQINPHFIFNCLNSIKSYIIENRIEDGTAFVGRFAQLIRMILNHSKERLIPFSKEIEAIQVYTWLEQQRLKDKFTIAYELDFETSTEALLIPPLLFQPYIENAIWHGLLPMQKKGRLVIKITELEEGIAISILDDGIGRKNAMEIKQQSAFQKSSMGLKLTSKRLTQINTMYGIEATVKIEDQYPDRKQPGTRVMILFPKINTSAHAANDAR